MQGSREGATLVLALYCGGGTVAGGLIAFLFGLVLWKIVLAMILGWLVGAIAYFLEYRQG